MITEEQAEELRRLIGAHTAAQVTAARSGALTSPYTIDAVTASAARLSYYIDSLTEDDSWDSDRRPGGDGVGVGE